MWFHFILSVGSDSVGFLDRVIFHCAGLKIGTNSVTFGTKFFPFVTKISGGVANL